MRIEAIYENGRLELAQPIRLRHARVRLVVEIPDAEVLPRVATSDDSLDDYARALEAELDAIRNAPIPPDADQPPLTAKQVERFDAFLLREDR